MIKIRSGGLLLASIAMPAFAQTSPDMGGEGATGDIVVTAQKREARLVDVSAPIAVVSGDRIERQTITSFEGLVENVPGISITSDYGGSGSKVISIRGVGGSDDYRPNGSSSVSMHVDNIYQASNLYLAVPFFDVARVEILKGPQGTLYGRNSTAGVINLITRGSTERQGYVDARYESFNRVRIEAAGSIPIANGIGLRLAGVTDHGGGYFDGRGAGPFAGRVFFPAAGPVPNPGRRDGFGDRKLFAGRATLDIEAGPQSKLTVKLFGSRDQGEPQQPDSFGGVNNGGFVEPDDNPYTFYSSFYPRQDLRIRGISGSFEQGLGDTLLLNVVSGYQKADRDLSGTGTGTPRRNFGFDFSDSLDQHSLEVRLSNRPGGTIDWVAGGYYIHDNTDFRTDLLVADVYATQLVSDYHQRRTSKAAFGQIDLHATDTLTLSGGLRYTKDDARFFGSTTDANPFGASTSPFRLPVVFDNRFDDDDVSGRATVSYRPIANANIYASIGKGYKAGGFDGSTIFSAPEALPFRSENVWAYEGGVKFSGPRGLFLNVDGFYYDFDDLQANTTIAIGPSANANVRTNVAKARLYGADINAGATLLHSGPHRVIVDGGVTLTRSKILDFRSTNPALVAVNLDNALPAAPKFSGNAQLAYTYEPGTGWTLGGTINTRHKSSEFKRLDNNDTSFVRGYTLIDARIDVGLPDLGVTLFGYVRNIADTTYFLDRNGTTRLVGAPRTGGVGARLAF